jgi:hypothetical protein
MVELVSIASFVLPFVLDSMLGRRINLKGIRLPRAKREPNLWHRMIRFAARIYKQLNFAQKEKLVDLGALPPDFEPKLLEILNRYLGKERQHCSYSCLTTCYFSCSKRARSYSHSTTSYFSQVESRTNSYNYSTTSY